MKLDIDLFLEKILTLSTGKISKRHCIQVRSSFKNLEWIVYNIEVTNQRRIDTDLFKILRKDYTKPIIKNKLNPDTTVYIGPNGINFILIEQENLGYIIQFSKSMNKLIEKQSIEMNFNDLIIHEEQITKSLKTISYLFKTYGSEWCTVFQTICSHTDRNNIEIILSGNFNQQIHDKLIHERWICTDTFRDSGKKLSFEYFKKDNVTIFLTF